MNLNVYIARCGHCSRRKADACIKEGRVAVNGVTMVAPWTRVRPDDQVVLDGKPVSAENYVYIIFNKPAGVTSTVEDVFAKKKIVDLIPKSLGRVYPVGRLDLLSRGLIILTNDGDLCYRLTHPRFGIEKEYHVTMRGKADEKLLSRLKRGVKDDGDHLKVRSARIVSATEKRSTLTVVVCEGKKRHLRRLFTALDATVIDLMRLRIGGLQLSSLKEGTFKLIDKDVLYKKTLQKSSPGCDNSA